MKNSLSVSYVNNDSDNSESDNYNNVEDLDKSSKDLSENNSISSSDDEEDEEDNDEICDLPSNKKKFNIADINTDMNSIYLDSD